MDYTVPLCWLALTVLFAVIEGVTPQLVSIWFAGGSLCAMIVSLFGADLWVDIAVFVGVSALLLILTRPLIKKRWNPSIVRTNADAAIGKTAIVTARIDNTEGVGLVNLGGQVWSARSETGDPIEEGASVRVRRIEGVKLIVTKEE